VNVTLLKHLVECRRNPSKRSYDYLHLVDLRDGATNALRNARGRWLDYGTIISPYEPLMPEAEVETADLVSDSPPELKPAYEFLPGENCPAPSDHFDGILSTQVLEHVAKPSDYLNDALRMLRPGGRLVLSTHGVWEDHPSPGDYHRWTAQGLRQLLENVGFQVERAVPLTCGFRGLSTLALAHMRPVPWKENSRLFRIRMRGLEGLSYLTNTVAGMLFSSDRFGREGDLDSSSRFYVALMVIARKKMATE
jgi:SAM-dependent methyltransferase